VSIDLSSPPETTVGDMSSSRQGGGVDVILESCDFDHENVPHCPHGTVVDVMSPYLLGLCHAVVDLGHAFPLRH